MQSYSIYIPRWETSDYIIRWVKIHLSPQIYKPAEPKATKYDLRIPALSYLQEKKVPLNCCCFPSVKFAPFPFHRIHWLNCSRHAIGSAVVGLLRLKSLQIFKIMVRLFKANRQTQKASFAASKSPPKKRPWRNWLYLESEFGVSSWSDFRT